MLLLLEVVRLILIRPIKLIEYILVRANGEEIKDSMMPPRLPILLSKSKTLQVVNLASLFN